MLVSEDFLVYYGGGVLWSKYCLWIISIWNILRIAIVLFYVTEIN